MTLRLKCCMMFIGIVLAVVLSGSLCAGESPGKEDQSKQFSARKPKIVDFYVDKLKIYKKEARPGEKIEFFFYLKNKGANRAEAVVNVHFTKVLNDLTESNRIYSRTHRIPVRNRAGGNILSHTLPLTHPTGKYFIIVVIDPENKVKETNERNNKKFWPIVINNRPRQARAPNPALNSDLATQNFRCSKTEVNDGDSINVSFQVKNLGNTRIKVVSYDLFLGFLRFLSGHIELKLQSGVFRDIAIGGQKSFSRSFSIPWNINPTPIRDIIVILDGGKKLDDKNRENNIAILPMIVNVRGRADLTISHLDKKGPRLSREGAPFNVGYIIKNVGTRTSLPSKCKAVFYKLEHRVTFDDGHATTTKSWRAVDVKEFTLLALRPNQSMPGTLRYHIPDGERGLKVYMKVDFQDVMIEANERNNENENTWE